MTTKMSNRDQAEELVKAFIEFKDLNLIARELGEIISDDELKEMMNDANKIDREGTMDRKDFLGISLKQSRQ